MHEVGLIQEAVRIAVESAENAGGRKVHLIRLRVGAMSGAVPDALRFAFDVVRRGTAAEDAVLDLDSAPAVFWCPRCRAEFAREDSVGECTRCHELSGELRRGTELELTAIEVS